MNQWLQSETINDPLVITSFTCAVPDSPTKLNASNVDGPNLDNKVDLIPEEELQIRTPTLDSTR